MLLIDERISFYGVGISISFSKFRVFSCMSEWVSFQLRKTLKVHRNAVVNSGAAEPTFTFHVGNCLQDMTFIECHDVTGSWITPPTDIPVNTADQFTISFPTNGGASTGNCTWEYTNGHGKWVAYWDWFVEILGDENFGMGTEDEIDDAETSLTPPLPFFNVVCGVFGYGQDGINYCIGATSPEADGCSNWN